MNLCLSVLWIATVFQSGQKILFSLEGQFERNKMFGANKDSPVLANQRRELSGLVPPSAQ